MQIILASGSAYRRTQLQAIGIAAQGIVPGVDETRQPGEAPAAMALRLARSKAAAVSALHPLAIVIGADQVAADGERIYGKPGSAAAQSAQLCACAGRVIEFHTALCVQRQSDSLCLTHVDLTRCQLRALTADEIERYVAAEPAYDCAGGFKVEGRGITLFEFIDSRDPSALIGLPLIALTGLLRRLGVELP